MDDQSARTSEESVAAGGVNMIFKLTGVVYDQNHDPVPSHNMRATLIYWQFVGGISTKVTDVVQFVTGIGGAYVYWYKGQMNPITLWDDTKPLGVTVANNQVGWTTPDPGQYGATPSGASPITVVISDTTIQQS